MSDTTAEAPATGPGAPCAICDRPLATDARPSQRTCTATTPRPDGQARDCYLEYRNLRQRQAYATRQQHSETVEAALTAVTAGEQLPDPRATLMHYGESVGRTDLVDLVQRAALLQQHAHDLPFGQVVSGLQELAAVVVEMNPIAVATQQAVEVAKAAAETQHVQAQLRAAHADMTVLREQNADLRQQLNEAQDPAHEDELTAELDELSQACAQARASATAATHSWAAERDQFEREHKRTVDALHEQLEEARAAAATTAATAAAERNDLEQSHQKALDALHEQMLTAQRDAVQTAMDTLRTQLTEEHRSALKAAVQQAQEIAIARTEATAANALPARLHEARAEGANSRNGEVDALRDTVQTLLGELHSTTVGRDTQAQCQEPATETASPIS